jgi:dipeptidyl aminopeptidase/acylaminoacyl peptidase
MKKLIALCLACLMFQATYSQTEKKPITHESMWMMKRVGAPAISPDGKWVIFSVTEPAYDEKEQVNDVWITSADGTGSPRKLTAGKAGESGYAWSPDGKYIAFSAKRDGDEESQIYLMNFKEGGEAQKLTTLSTGASAPQWSPDGKMILFHSNVFPQVYADSTNKKMNEEKKKIKYKARVYTSFPVRSWDHWLDEKQTHAFVQPVEPGSKARDIFADVAISKLSGFQYTGATWSSSSTEIVFSASTDFNTGAYQEQSYHLYKVAVSGGDATKLTSDKFDYTSPQISDDGKYLLSYTSPNNNYKVYNDNKLVRFDWPSMQNRTMLAPTLDRPINKFLIQNGVIYMSVEDQGRDKLFTLAVAGGDAKLISQGAVGCYTNLDVSTEGEPVIVSSFESASMPPEVAKLKSDGTHQLLTQFNEKALAALDLQPVETVWFTSSRGKKIRSLLVKPAGFDAGKKYPLFVLMHGGPAGAWKENWGYRWNYHLLAKPGYVMILTDYTGSTGYGNKFGQDIQYDPFKGPCQEINEAAADAIKKFPFIDATKQAAGGASYGGHLANWMQATTTHYKCLISHAGLVNSVSQWGTSDGIYSREVMNGGAPWTEAKTWKEQNPYKFAPSFKTPMLVTVGELDYRVPVNNSLENWHILQRQKVPSKLIVFPEENHWILKAENSRFFYKEVHAWLETYLK